MTKSTDHSSIRKNLLEATIQGYNLADQHGVESDWYKTAREQVAKAADLLNLPADYVASIVAITSANCNVKNNWDRALKYLTTGDVEFCGHNCKAFDERYRATGSCVIIGSDGKPTPKTDQFRLNICPIWGSDNAITVDRHVFDASQGPGVVGVKITETLRYRCKTAIHSIARELKLSPCHVQACLWVDAKWSKGHKDIGNTNGKCPFSEFLIGDYFEEKLQFEGIGA